MIRNAQRVQSLFLAAVEARTPTARAVLLEHECGTDAELRQRVEALLRAHEAPASFLDEPSACLDMPLDGPICEHVGTVIGPYKLLERIGEGGFGVVFMAEQQKPVRRKVALKVLKPGMDSRQVIARFEAERQALALMDHPHIAHVFDGGETATGRPYFVMELVRGIPFTEFCAQNCLPIRQRLDLFIDVCQAVQHAHQKGIIHRDLKPSNMLVTLHDGTPVIKVIDFGIAKATGQQLTDKTLFTQFAQLIGTPLYMSPEQASMSGLDVDTRSDIYSLGVLLYELLTGTTPFDNERLKEVDYDELRRIIREEEPPKPSTRISTLGQAATTISSQRQSDPRRLSQLLRGELDWIVMRALEKDRSRRYETASAFAADVERYLHDEPVLACPPSLGYRLRKFARRNKGRLAVAVLALCFLAALGGVAGWAAKERADRAQETALQQAAQQVETARREAELRTTVTAALDKVADLHQRSRWDEARVVLEQVQERLGPSGPQDLRQQVQQAEADLKLVDRLDAARLKSSGVVGSQVDFPSVARDYAAAFRQGGITGQATEAAEVVAARIRASAVREQLMAAMDDWALREGNPARRAWLLAVARAADPDPWRDRFRDAAVWNNRTALERLAREAKVSELSPQILFVLGRLLLETGADAVPLLTAAQRRFPSCFWLNSQLAFALHQAKRYDEAIGYYRAALALRPATSLQHDNLGNALRATGRVDEAIAEYETAIEFDPKFALAHCHLRLALRDKGPVCEPKQLAKLPESERPAWRRLWKDVADMLKQAQAKAAPRKN
ncbi:MAG TPA: protein kinase [Gemmataceae bacterium]|nr:protein kinase [Gemmataceae bacterium]